MKKSEKIQKMQKAGEKAEKRFCIKGADLL